MNWAQKKLGVVQGFVDELMGKAEEAKKDGKSFFDKAKSGGDTPEKLDGVKEKYETKRTSLLGEVWSSFVKRKIPGVSKFWDMCRSFNIFKKDKEQFAWEHEFQAATAWTMVIPDFMLKVITDPLANSEVFLTLVKNWPLGGEKFASKIQSKKDPDDVVNVLRMMQQDLATGKVSWGSVKGWF